MHRLVRPVAVVMPRIPSQDLPEMLVTKNQQVIKALAAKRADEPFHKGVPRGDRTGALMTRVPFPAKT